MSDKTGLPTHASMKFLESALSGGDYYSTGRMFDQDRLRPIMTFAWPVLLQAAKFAVRNGSRLNLTKAGEKAFTGPLHETLRLIWKRWLGSSAFDEMRRIDVIKGQQGKGRRTLNAVPARRQAISRALQKCPIEKWIDVDEFFLLDSKLIECADATLDRTHRKCGSYESISSACWRSPSGSAIKPREALSQGVVEVGLYLVALTRFPQNQERWRPHRKIKFEQCHSLATRLHLVRKVRGFKIMSKGVPRRKRMNRAGRLQSAKHWLPTYHGRDLVKGYRKWYGVSSVCAIIELRQLGIKVDEQRLIQARQTEESTALARARKKQRRIEERAAVDALLVESDEHLAYIAGHTPSGFPYGVTWEELEAAIEP